MKIYEIHNLTAALENEDDEKIEEYEDTLSGARFTFALKEMAAHAENDFDALYCFFEFVTNTKGSSGAEYDWDAEDFQEAFTNAFRGSSSSPSEVIRQYFSQYETEEGSLLPRLAADANAAPYFDWEGYVTTDRPDLHPTWRGRNVYLFEGE